MEVMAGRPKDVEDWEILEAATVIHGPATAKELAERLDMSRSGVNKRLDKLVDRGLLFEKKVGANAVIYWLTDEGERHLANH